MNLDVKFFIKSVEHDLANWEKGLAEIAAGTFKYDDSLPKSCTDALYKHKVQVCKETLVYLKGLPLDKVIQTNIGTTKEGSKYYELINK